MLNYQRVTQCHMVREESNFMENIGPQIIYKIVPFDHNSWARFKWALPSVSYPKLFSKSDPLSPARPELPILQKPGCFPKRRDFSPSEKDMRSFDHVWSISIMVRALYFGILGLRNFAISWDDPNSLSSASNFHLSAGFSPIRHEFACMKTCIIWIPFCLVDLVLRVTGW